MPQTPVSPARRCAAGPRRCRIGGPALLALLTAIGLTGCGRSAPLDALAELEGDPDIAGVSITSPDAVVATEPTSPAEIVTSSTSAAAPTAQATYTVQPGDTLSAIAGQFGVSIEALADFNGIADVDSIAPGEQLAIPPQPVEVTVVDAEETTTTQP